MDKTKLTGIVITPENSKYEELRHCNNLYFSYYPRVIVYPSNTKDVINAVNYARENNLNIRIRCGGHNYESFCVADDSMIIDVTHITNFDLDTEHNVVKAGAGFLQSDFYAKLYKFGYGFNGGSCGGVGITGYTLGGGIGYFQREQGIGSDNLLEVEMVNYKGEVIIANDCQNSDLFYALRGAGSNNFGVITSLTYKVYPVDKVTIMFMSWPKSRAKEVINTFQKIADDIDNRITFKINMSKDIIRFACVTTFADINFTMNQFTSLIQIPDKTHFEVKTVPYIDYIIAFGGEISPSMYYKRTGIFVYEPIGPDAVDTIYRYLDNSLESSIPAGVGYIAMGGKIKENKCINSCFAHRNAKFLMQIEANWTAKEKDKSCDFIEWVECLRNTLYPYSAPAYLNYPDICIKNYLKPYFGYHVSELKYIKSKYNPSNLFDYPQSL